MLNIRIVNVGRGARRSRTLIKTEWAHGAPGTEHAELHEQVTLETPHELTDTARMRILTVKESRDA